MHLHFAFTQFMQALPYGAEPRLASAESMSMVVRKAVGMFVLQMRGALGETTGRISLARIPPSRRLPS
jgi:hypothetical protein